MVKIRGRHIQVLRKMDVMCYIYKVLLLQMLWTITWCSGKNIDSVFRVQHSDTPSEVEGKVQDNIRNIVHNGIYSQKHLDPSQVQVVWPTKVTRDGRFVSHALDHAHPHGHARARRDLHLKDHELDHVLHYHVNIDGNELRLDLRPSVTFITPAMIIETHTPSGRTRQQPGLQTTACHYTGSVRDQPYSSVALSACDGLTGMLRTRHGEYFIEPSDQIPKDSSEGRPHIIFRRSAVDKVQAQRRAKRAAENYTPQHKNRYGRKQNSRNFNTRNRDYKEMIDRRRRERLEARRKELRRNPAEYRHLQTNNTHIDSVSNSIEINKSLGNNKKRRTKVKSNKAQRHRKRLRRLRRRKSNCATKQPPYPIEKTLTDYEIEKNHRTNKKSRIRPHHHQLSHGSEFEETRRSTRSVSKPRHVEVLLVADKSMTNFHDNVELYLLTIMNMVSSLYMDPSIGNYIKVVVVKIILIEDDHNSSPRLNVSPNATKTLESFCEWQHQLNPDSDANPHHHDVAVLVTRENLCSELESYCSTLGVAHVAGMCIPNRSCSVNEDNGIRLAHTITHELGHNFGLFHDTQKIGCHRREGSTLHIMTPMFEADSVQVAWSRCSKRDVTVFLDMGGGECLGDTPSQDYEYPEVLAGITYDATAQCHLQFGTDAVACHSQPSDLCKYLWCSVNNTCKTLMLPPAPGTSCDEDMWCQNQNCVPRSPLPKPQDGGWGDWSEWSECSRTCGAGVSTKTRDCNRPEPINNGKYCIGERSRYKICNTEPCPIGEPSFREIQCRKYNNDTEEFEPYFNQDKPCMLICDSNGKDIDVFVTDGTPCSQAEGARDMCIGGVCHKVGCDWIVDSELEEDSCGVCGGNGSGCDTVQGVYNKGTTKKDGFSEVAVIPAGSWNVAIKEKNNDGNFFSIRSAKTKHVYMSGAQNQQLKTEYFVAGSQAIYERDRDWEKVRIPGPIKEDLTVYQRINRGKNRNPMVSYKYTVDRSPTKQQIFRYRLSDWSPCSVTCGEGNKRRDFQCVDEQNRLVEQSQCYHLEQQRDAVRIEKCHRAACPGKASRDLTHWWTGHWSTCSRACRMPGEESLKQRNVYCVDKIHNTITNDSKCDPVIKPISSIICADIPPC